MDKKQVGMILFIFIILYCCYHVPYRIECPGDCQIEIDIPGEQHLILSDEERDEAILLLNQLMIRRRFTFSHSNYAGEPLYDDNHTYVHVYVEGDLHRMKYQLLVMFNQNRVIVQEFFREPTNYKEVVGNEAVIKEFVSTIQEKAGME